MSDNGKDDPTIIRDEVLVEHENGIKVFVTPPPPYVVLGMQAKIEADFPYPDGDLYRLPMEHAAIEGKTLPPEENPEYRALLVDVDKARKDVRIIRLIAAAISRTEPAKEDLIAQYEANYGADLDRWQGYGYVEADPWHRTIHGLLLTSLSWINKYMALVNQTAPLTMPEVIEGVHQFRLDV